MRQTQAKTTLVLALAALMALLPLTVFAPFDTAFGNGKAETWTLEWSTKPTDARIIDIIVPSGGPERAVAISDEFQVFMLDDDGSNLLQSSTFTPPFEGKIPSTIFVSTDKDGKYVAWLSDNPPTLNIFKRSSGQTTSVSLDYRPNARPLVIEMSSDGKDVYIGDIDGYVAKYTRD